MRYAAGHVLDRKGERPFLPQASLWVCAPMMLMTKEARERQEKILEIIEKKEICSQGELVEALAEEGMQVSQTTICRDIRQLRLEKRPTQSGNRAYAVTDEWLSSERQILMRLFRDSVRSIESSMNLIVIKTRNGSAGAAAEAIDSFPNKKILGTIAGDNTLFVATSSRAACKELADAFREML